jgi:putative ABC transport system permease protein
MIRIDPPRFPFKVLQFFCKPCYFSDIEGDLYELFDRDVITSGKRKATFLLFINVMRLLRPGLIRSFNTRSYNRYDMFKHNVLISLRSFRRYKMSFIVNVAGLSTGFTCVLLIALWISDELAMDQFHVNKDRLYQYCENVEQKGQIITRVSTSGPTAAALAAEFPEVEMAVITKLEWIQTAVLTAGETNVKAKELHAGTDFFRMFSFPLIEGNPSTVLSDKKYIIISESMAIALFGTKANLLGKTVKVNHNHEYEISGIMKDVGSDASVRFDFVNHFEVFREGNDWLETWFSTAPQTHVLLREGADVDELNKKIAGLVKAKTDGKHAHRTGFLRKHSDAYLHGRYQDGKLVGGRIEYVQLFGVIALFILLIACINFMNLSTARASRRAKEVGVKKVIGARQGSLVSQYLAESTLVALFSLAIAMVLAWVLLPQFNLITGKNLTLTLNSALLPYLPVIVILTGLLAGSYPALYLTKFKPVTILKGKLDGMMGEVLVRKGLVIFQFTLSIVLIVSVLVVYQQIQFIQSKNLGYNRDNVLILNREGALWQKQDAFIAEVKRIPGVINVAASGHDMTGHNGGTGDVVWPGKDPDDRTEFERFPGDFNLIDLLGMEIKEGRNFSPDNEGDRWAVIFNEAAIRFMGLKDPVGQTLKVMNADLKVIGVVRDFNFETFRDAVKPAVFFIKPEWTGNILIRLEQGKEQETLSRLEKFYATFNPGFPFAYHFIDEDYQKMYTAETRVAKLSGYFAGLAIVISCLGLFGLAAFTAERRIKEIGIRKVMGSTSTGIVYLLSVDLIRMVLAAMIIGLPFSAWLATQWLNGFAFRIELAWWIFVASGLAALMIAWITVAVQTMKAAAVNPVECLRSE